MITKEEIEKSIFENPMYQNALKNIPENEKPQVIAEIKKIVNDFYSNILLPFEKLGSR